MNEDIHDQVHAFADGELSAAEAADFRLHLGSCTRCLLELGDILQLQAQGEALREEATPGRAPAPSARRAHAPAWARRRAVLAAAAGSALVAALAWAVLHLPGPGRGAPIRLALADRRTLEARLTWPGASPFRPYGVQRGAQAKPEQVPLPTLAALEEQHDLHGLATGYLLRGEPEQAARYLEHAGSTPDVNSDRAVLALDRGAPEEALVLLDRALAKDPKHPQALWNRALVLRELELPLLAAETFRRVAALGEPGWSEEARQRADSLAQTFEERRRAFRALDQAGREMATRETLVSESAVRELPGTLRIHFEEALRSARSAERVRALLPLARAFDQHYGGDAVEREVQEVARRDFTRPLELQELALKTHDPWFTFFGQLELGRVEYSHGELTRAETRLNAALAACNRTALRYRCAQLESLLAEVTAAEHRLPEAREHAAAGLRLAREGNELALERKFLGHLADLARLRADPSLAEAYLGEFRLEQP